LNSQSLSSFCLDGLYPKLIFKDRRIDHTSIRQALSGKMHSLFDMAVMPVSELLAGLACARGQLSYSQA
jgi:hypothetical protein